MISVLRWAPDKEHLSFFIEKNGQRVPVEQWATVEAVTPAGRKARVGYLLRAIDQHELSIENATTSLVPHEIASRFTEEEAMGLGLPEIAPFSIEIEPVGQLTKSEFNLEYHFYRPNGSPVTGARKEGCLVYVADELYLCPWELFRIIKRIDELNERSDRDMESNFKAWAGVQEVLPEDYRAPEHLKKFRLVLASRLTINPFLNEQQEPDFDPVFGSDKFSINQETDQIERHEFTSVLPEARQGYFAKQFRQRKALQQYAAGHGWYLLIPEKLKTVVDIVKEKQMASPAVRRDFVMRPQLYLREALQDEVAEEEIENIFYDDGRYSERVKGIGIWEPRVIPWIKTEPERWIPEEYGLEIDGERIPIPIGQIESICKQVKQAIAAGETSVTIGEKEVPATDGVLGRLDDISAGLEAIVEAQDDRQESVGEKLAAHKIVLLTEDNVEHLNIVKEHRASSGEPGRQPASLRSTLLPHQVEALLWLQSHWCEGSRGALLADDMGLGKTLEVMSFLAWLKEEIRKLDRASKPVLVVAPTGLLENWRDEHEKHFDNPGIGFVQQAFGNGLKELRVPGAAKTKELRGGLPVLDTQRLKESEWVLTTYETLRDYQHSFGRVDWSVIVFDEAQKIKNPTSGLTQAAQAMKSDLSIAMTGTPVENGLSDLWSIMDTVHPGQLNDLKTFLSKYASSDSKQQAEDLDDLRQYLVEISEPPLMRRKTKEEQLTNLPQKQESKIEIPMPKRQAAEYESIVNKAQSGDMSKGAMLKVLQQLRAVSLHPCPRLDEDDEAFINDSARCVGLFQVLDKIAKENEKALVFIEMRHMQGPLQEIIQRRYNLERPPMLITGAVSGKKRKERVNLFQNRPGFEVMVLSPKAGGVGLTLTAANHVIHLSRWWNPAVEDQSNDRVYRIGQEKLVWIHHLMAVHPVFGDASFDIKLDALLKRKRQLSASLLLPPVSTSEDEAELFTATVTPWK